uniref:Uncharacterized protein n=1 Tax=Gossypium raimondii TaxID=29730 RepID=A0A0D2Q0X0_GOSRA|nr:hypothetical protein B456_006G003400 [Gossypium raimondii]KJB33233.1 hypothetical protein B456_006G003400 [Gossypium raimondii]
MSHIIGRMHLMQEKMGWVKIHILLRRRLYRLGRMMELKGTGRAIFLRVHVNFGQKKFAFDVKEYEAQERLKQQMTIEKISLPPNISYGQR